MRVEETLAVRLGSASSWGLLPQIAAAEIYICVLDAFIASIRSVLRLSRERDSFTAGALRP